jgi:hypothetical protein
MIGRGAPSNQSKAPRPKPMTPPVFPKIQFAAGARVPETGTVQTTVS